MAQFIYIHGYPAVGKATVAKELAKLIPRSENCDIYSLMDPVAASTQLERASPEYQSTHSAFRRSILNLISESDVAQRATWIFSDWHEGGHDYQTAAAERGAPFISVILLCDEEEHLKRVVGAERGLAYNNTKLNDADALRNIREQHVLHRFGGPTELELNTTNISPTEAAQKIVDHIGNVVHHDQVS
jgi:broad-specificity NMP kinase